GGTCTGEHGVGIGKRKFMQLEHGDSYQLMRSIKDLIDPKGLMNPGKIFIRFLTTETLRTQRSLFVFASKD
ncbi:MAG: hypothetical protein HKO68_17980, partial [Desulfobacterales bacterium]|nr:hypothetical protein [Desulfobacterales bacterium]